MSNVERDSIWDEWLNLTKNMQPEFVDDDVCLIYKIVFENDLQLFSRMLDVYAYKSILKNISIHDYEFVDRDTILCSVKDLVLVDGCQNSIIDGYMDWEGFIQEEIDENYIEFEGQYIRYEYLEDLYKEIERYIWGE